MLRRNIFWPWWISLILAVGGYIVLSEIVPRWPTGNPYLQRVLKSVAPLLAVVIAGAFLLMAAASIIALWQRRRLLDRHHDLASLRQLRWQDFERLVGEVYRRQGWRVQETGGGGADGGIDLILTRGGETWFVQCKRQRETISVKTVRELLGVVASKRAAGGIFITISQFTRDAEAFAREQSLVLVDGNALLQMVKTVQKGANEPANSASDMKASSCKTEPPVSATTPSQAAPSIVLCPQCGAPMARRIAQHGQHEGKAFWGCTSYPACRGTRRVSARRGT